MEDRCSECNWKNGWHLSGCSKGILNDAEIEAVRAQLKEGIEKAKKAYKIKKD